MRAHGAASLAYHIDEHVCPDYLGSTLLDTFSTPSDHKPLLTPSLNNRFREICLITRIGILTSPQHRRLKLHGVVQ